MKSESLILTRNNSGPEEALNGHKQISNRSRLDRWGFFLSGLCLVHCFFTPFIISLLPALHFLDNETYFHGLLAIPLVLIAYLALFRGYKRHKRKIVLILGFVGIFFIFLIKTKVYNFYCMILYSVYFFFDSIICFYVFLIKYFPFDIFSLIVCKSWCA